MSNNLTCIYCNDDRVVKHGKTSNGQTRYRCRACGKTWISRKKLVERPKMSEIVASYLDGITYRELVSIYHSSPQRINQKIREFLEGCPSWEDYLDTYIENHHNELIYLVCVPFSCLKSESHDNKMCVALAIDALSTVIIGYEISSYNNYEIWYRLLKRLHKRDVTSKAFMTNGMKQIEDAVKEIYPNSDLKINYHRNYRDRELTCCLKKERLNDKLISDATRIFNMLDNKHLKKYLRIHEDKSLNDFLEHNQEEFLNRLRYRLENKSELRIEGMLDEFRHRFERFHMLKDDPEPLINGLIARKMLSKTDMGFSRLSLYSQKPSATVFSDFACGVLPKLMNFEPNSKELKAFLLEITARSLELPVIISRCDLQSERCCLL
jgi:transposase-like protein